jgi:hypothetical protein
MIFTSTDGMGTLRIALWGPPLGLRASLIRDVPDDVIAAVDAHAGRLGLSRSEYVRRRLAQDASAPGSLVSVQDLARFADVFSDLADPEVMSRAWQ